MTTVRELRRAWPSLEAPAPADVVGTFEASFARPLTHVAPRGLGLVGLPRWYGKRFVPAGDASLSGINLQHRRSGDGLDELLPMAARVQPSRADGRPALVVTYADDAPRPWRWVRDELRPWTDDRFIGLTFVDAPGVRRLPGTPFVLTRRA